MTERPAPHTPRFRWLSAGPLLLVLGAALAAFFLPQEAPLSWYPLRHAEQDVHYLQVRLAGDRSGEAALGYLLATDAPGAWRWIRIPVSPTEELLTYTFPLPDAPLAAVRWQGLPAGGAVRAVDFQVTDRSERLLMHFNPGRFRAAPGSTIATGLHVWTLRTDLATPALAEYTLPAPLLSPGAKARNLQRCLRSVGYLSGLSVLLLGAIALALARPRLREIPALAGYLALVALALAAVANRGLIRETVRIARYVPPAVSTELALEIELAASDTSPAQLFWDQGRGIRQEDSARASVTAPNTRQVLRFPLPPASLHALRWDPCDGAGVVQVRAIRLVDAAGRTRGVLAPRTLAEGKHVRCEPVPGPEESVLLVCNGPDPSTVFSATALASVNRAVTGAR